MDVTVSAALTTSESVTLTGGVQDPVQGEANSTQYVPGAREKVERVAVKLLLASVTAETICG